MRQQVTEKWTTDVTKISRSPDEKKVTDYGWGQTIGSCFCEAATPLVVAHGRPWH
jgi:hypothetical protein